MKILHINASPRGPDSQSQEVAQAVIDGLCARADASVDRLDLFDGALPAFDAQAVGAKMALFAGVEATEDQKRAWRDVEALFQRFAAADTYVVNTPLWNNGIPYVLKHFVDLVTQPGWSFGFDPATGYSGLMTGRRAIVVQASGVYHDGIAANFGSDFATPYLRDWFRFIGVELVAHLPVGPTVLNGDYAGTKARALAQAAAISQA